LSPLCGRGWCSMDHHPRPQRGLNFGGGGIACFAGVGRRAPKGVGPL